MSRRKLDRRRETRTESHRHMATEKELKVAEKAREHQVEIEEEIEVDKQNAAESKKVTQKQQEGAANSYKSLKKPGRLQRRKPKNENMRWRLRSRRLPRLTRKPSLRLRLLTERNKLHTRKKAGQRAARVVREGVRRESGS